jgi:hypothetical protein
VKLGHPGQIKKFKKKKRKKKKKKNVMEEIG